MAVHLLETPDLTATSDVVGLTSVLVGDVGGTNARFALYRYSHDCPYAGEISRREILGVADYPDFSSAVAAYLEAQQLLPTAIDGACLAVASAVVGNEVSFTNSPWRFSVPDVIDRFGFKRLKVINDFEALGTSIRNLSTKSTIVVQRGEGPGNGTEIVLGPGTGLGIAVRHCDSGIIIPSEGGHVSFAPTDSDERALLDFISAEFSRVSYERILSGGGLVRLYAFQRLRLGTPVPDVSRITAAQVVGSAGEGTDSAADWAVDRFLRVLGHFAGDSVLMFGAFRGVYLAGGILPRICDRLLTGGFLERFTQKGRFSSLMKNIPIRLITDDTASLRGAAFSLLQAK